MGKALLSLPPTKDRQALAAKLPYVTIVLPPYQIFFRDAGLHTLADIESRKIRTSGKAKELALQALGGVPMRLPRVSLRTRASPSG